MMQKVSLHQDFIDWLEKNIPSNPGIYKHNKTGETNGDAHIKRQFMGREVVNSYYWRKI